MIQTKDRSEYIGASDTKYVIGNWETKTFEKWWLKKLGIDTSSYDNKFTLAGTHFEHKIIDALEIENIQKDKQFIKGRLRVNLDANTDECIYEIKTYQLYKGFDIKKHHDYINQVQVQMYCSGIHKAKIVAYGLEEKDYDNYFNNIEKKRILVFNIKYNQKWIKDEYLPNFKILEECLVKGKYPKKIKIIKTLKGV